MQKAQSLRPVAAWILWNVLKTNIICKKISFCTSGKALVDDMINYGQDATKVESIKCCAETCENDKSKSGKCC